MAFKIDLIKAFDCLEWGIIYDTVLGFTFPVKFINLVMDCITSSSISVLWNGETTESFKPSRGIRQVDPLSPNIFVLCMEHLYLMIEHRITTKNWIPFKISRNINLSHLFYADDVFLFCVLLILISII